MPLELSHTMRRNRLPLILLALAASPAAFAQPGARPSAPVADLVRRVTLPYEQFTLANGLRVVVHTDRKAPVVSLHTWYDVGSGDEPVGKTGYAHLFEHLMFAGSENVANYDTPLENAGGQNNGSTFFDRTNYFVNMPKGALDLALFEEADRMGRLLPALTQPKLDNQRGVVQNEKRQGDNQPYGLIFYAVTQNLFPAGHPYNHSPIGSMADLDRASLADVQAWYRDHYTPNNAVIAIAGDISAAEAHTKVERYFGAIPRGPAIARATPPIPRLSAPKAVTMRDRVPNARVYRVFAVPGRRDPVSPLLGVAAGVLGGGGSSRLYNDLVRDAKVATDVSVDTIEAQLAGALFIQADVKAGVDPAVVGARIDAAIARLLRDGPTADEVERVATSTASGAIRGLETANAAASTLADGLLFTGDPVFFKTQLARIAAATPASVRAAAREWLSRPPLVLTILPGERGPAELAMVGASGVAPKPRAEPLATVDASKLPAVTRVDTVTFPKPERTTLSNGVRVTFARRGSVPVVTMIASFDAGLAADPPRARGTAALTTTLMSEGTPTRTGRQIVEEAERLGMSFGIGSGLDRTQGTMSALTSNLTASLALFADVLRNPVFVPAEVERVRAIRLSDIAQETATPGGIATRLLAPALYGADHPYGGAPSGLGEAAVVARLSRADLAAWHHAWIRPDAMQLFVTGDTTLAELTPRLEAAFGGWRPDPAVSRGAKSFPPTVAPKPATVTLVDRPNSPQSFITGGHPLPLRGLDDPLVIDVANDQLGGAFTSRLNIDLRETRGWAYGVRSGARTRREQMAFTVSAPVQADKTGAALGVLRDDIVAYGGPKPITPDELTRIVNSNVLGLPGAFETQGALVGALATLAEYGRPDDYYVALPARYRAFTPASVAAAARAFDPSRFQWVVVGDAQLVAPQLTGLGLPVEVRPAR